jgi:hypothetical protein
MAESTTPPDSQSGGAFRQLGGCLWSLLAIGLLIFFVAVFGEQIASVFYSNLYGSPQLVNSLRSTIMTEEWPLMVCVPSLQREPDEAAASNAQLDAAVGPSSQANALANLRGGPALDFFVVRVVDEGESLQLIAYAEVNGERWYLLRSGEWILGELVDSPPANLPLVTLPRENEEQEAIQWNGLTWLLSFS